MVAEALAVSGRSRAMLCAIAGTVLFLAGCSLPGVSFHGVPKQQQAEGYKIQAITPSLLAEQESSRSKKDVTKSNSALQQAISSYAYQVEPQDVLSVNVWGHPEFSSPTGAAAAGVGGLSSLGNGGGGSGRGGFMGGSAGGLQANVGGAGAGEFSVESDGTIFFPYVGNIKVAGLTTSEIRDKLTQALSKFVVNPQVSVSVAQFNSQTYQLSGAVFKPGLYPVTSVPVTVSEAIQLGGGILRTIPNVTVASKAAATPLADLAHVLYIHDGERQILDLRAFFQNGDESQDRLLHAGDIVEVPDNTYDQVHLIGEVEQPGDYPLDNGKLNLAEVLGRAGGLSLATANPSRIFVFRGTYQKPEIFWLDARSPVAMLLATQFELQPQDVVYVATAGISTWNRIITQILPTVEMLNQGKQLVK